jgi:hypothetical protein
MNAHRKIMVMYQTRGRWLFWTLDPTAVSGTCMCGEREEDFLWDPSPLIPVLVTVGIQKAWRQPGGGWDHHILDTPPQGSGYQQNEDVTLLSIILKHFSF